jgi:serine/threonine protein kinase
LQGGRATRSSDQYSFGVLAWQLVTGSHPFQADDLVTLLRRRHDPLPDLPEHPELHQVLCRMLACDPHARYDNIEQAASALRAALRRKP